MTHFIHTPHDGGIEVFTGDGDWLEVRRGMTQFPRRPLVSDRFLIGSGSNCHLQLGGGMPMLHTLLTREQDEWVAEAIAPEPQLFVNDSLCRRQTLCIDDVIRIGAFEFVLRRGVDRKRTRDSFEDDSLILSVDQILRTVEQANPDALVLNRRSDAAVANGSDVEVVRPSHPLRRAVDHTDAALRLLIAQDAHERAQSMSSQETPPRPRNRVA